VGVRVRLEQSGGFAAIPGLSQPVEVDTTELGSDAADTVEALVRRTGLLEGSLRSVAEPSTGADLRNYTLTVQDGDTTQTVRLRDPLDDDVAALVEQLRSLRHRPT
jgi:Emfourin